MTEPNTAPAVSQEPAAPAAPEPAAAETQPQSYADRIAALVAEDAAPATAPEKPADKPKETPPAQTEQDRALADAALKEGRAWRLQQQLKREQEAFRVERAEWQPKVEAAQRYESAIAKGDVIGAVQQLAERMGRPFHELYFALSKQVADTTMDKTPQQLAEEIADRKLAAFEARQKAEREAEQQRAQAEQQEAQRKASLQQGQHEALQQVTEQLSRDADRWPVLSGYDPRMVAGQVLHLMTEDYAKKRAEHGKEYAARNLLDFADALDTLESRKQAQAQADYERAAAKKKAAQAIGNAAPAASPTGHAAGRPRTIEHSHVADAATPRKLTYQERLAQLIAEDDRKG